VVRSRRTRKYGRFSGSRGGFGDYFGQSPTPYPRARVHRRADFCPHAQSAGGATQPRASRLESARRQPSYYRNRSSYYSRLDGKAMRQPSHRNKSFRFCIVNIYIVQNNKQRLKSVSKQTACEYSITIVRPPSAHC
jgi:hypothetical protein